MGVILAIMMNTIREVVRQRLFLLVISLTIALIAILILLPYFTFRQDPEMFKDLALSTVTLAVVLLVALTASSVMAEELESQTATTLLAKPVARWQFLVGKYLGVMLALLVAVAVLGAVLFLTSYMRVYMDAFPREKRLAFTFSESEPAREFQGRMLNHALAVLPGSAMVFYQGAVLGAVAVVLASRFSRVVAALVTFALFLVGHLSEFVELAVRQSTDLTRTLTTWAIRVLPFLATFNITGKLAHSALGPGNEDFAAVWSYTALAGLYAAGYVAFILLLGSLLMRRREVK